MKNLLLGLLLCSPACLFSQPMADTGIVFAHLRQPNKVSHEESLLKIENLGMKVNSDLPELRPMISPDGELLFFIRQNHPRNKGYNVVPNSQDIWFSMKDKQGNWTEAVHLGAPLNTVEYNAVLWISPDNNRLLIRNAFVRGIFMGDGISMCYLTKSGNWSKPEMLRIKNFEKFNRGISYGASMANDGQTLLLYMSPKPESRENDLYVSFLKEDGSWTEPKDLGNTINLKGHNQMSPYLASDGRTLYFSSDRPGGFGNMDIWKSTRNGANWRDWSEPVNLGSSVNTPGWETFFTLDATGEYAYLSTEQSTYGSTDIARVKLSDVQRPEPVVLLTGKIYNAKTNKPIGAKLIYETVGDGLVAGNAVADPFDGSFKIVLPYKKNYSISAQENSYFAVSQNLNLDTMPGNNIQEMNLDLYLYPLPLRPGETIGLNNVTVNSEKLKLNPGSFLELDRLGQVLANYPSMTIEINGNSELGEPATDTTSEANVAVDIGELRAKAVVDYLVAKGIEAGRLKIADHAENPFGTGEKTSPDAEIEFRVLEN